MFDRLQHLPDVRRVDQQRGAETIQLDPRGQQTVAHVHQVLAPGDVGEALAEPIEERQFAVFLQRMARHLGIHPLHLDIALEGEGQRGELSGIGVRVLAGDLDPRPLRLRAARPGSAQDRPDPSFEAQALRQFAEVAMSPFRFEQLGQHRVLVVHAPSSISA